MLSVDPGLSLPLLVTPLFISPLITTRSHICPIANLVK